MSKISLSKDGKLVLPTNNGYKHLLEGGGMLVLQPSEYGLMLHFVRPDLQRVYLEVTSRCNLNCEMCVRHVWRDERGEMSWDTFQTIMAGLKAFPKFNHVVFGGFGEPLTHPRIVDMVAQVHAMGAGTTMITNGLLLNKAMAQTLLEAGLDKVVVSLDPMHLQAYRQAGLHTGVDQVLDNLSNLHELIRVGGFSSPALGLEYVIARSNLEELYRLPELARQVGASFAIVSNLLPHTPDLSHEIVYDSDKPLNLGGGWGVHRAGWVRWGSANLPRMKWGAWRQCRFVKDNSVSIGWDGGVSPCLALLHSYTYYIYGRRKDVTRYTLGNVREKSLLELWTDEEYVKFRGNVQSFNFPSCVDCGMACTFAEENSDCWGNTPSCADCLWAQDIIRCP